MLPKVAALAAVLAAFGNWQFCSAQTNVSGIWTGTSSCPGGGNVLDWGINMNQLGNSLSGTAFFNEPGNTYGNLSFTGIISGSAVWIESSAGTYSFYGTVSNMVMTGGIFVAYGYAGTCGSDNTLGSFTLAHYGSPFPNSVLTVTTSATSGANFVVSGSGGIPNGTYRVLSSTNLALPLGNWCCVQTNNFDTNGGFRFTNSICQTTAGCYFSIQVP